MKGFMKLFLVILTLSLIIGVIVCLFVYQKLSVYKDVCLDEQILSAQVENKKSILYFFDRYDKSNNNFEVYSEFSSNRRCERVEYSDIPENLINAFIAIEDKNFFSHNGVDLLRTSRATANYILKKESDFGASTITQQLVKNLTGYDEITPTRKINEIFCAINLEKIYTKQEILTMYLNIINLGSGCVGVLGASKYYFSKDLDELELIECAAIAAITNNPSYYDPSKHPENNKARRNIILDCMLKQGYIDENEHLTATNEELNLNISGKLNNTVNSWYADMVFEDVACDLCQKYSISRSAASNMIYCGGLRIYTAIDLDMQKIVEQYYESAKNFQGVDKGLCSSLILIDSSSGDILAVAGNIGKKDKNRIQSFATSTKRPSGSAIKPLSVYAPALENSIINWSSIVNDSPIKMDDKDWPKNADGKYYGDVDIEFAIAKSLNTVPVKLLEELTIEKSIEFLKEKLCFDSMKYADREGMQDMCPSSLALGQHKYGVTLKELTAAYCIFNSGEYIKPRSYYKVCDSSGKIILDNQEERERAISEQNAAIMTKLLEGVVDNGTANNSIALDKTVDVAGKTGTTQNNCDRYFIGYTPSFVCGVWMGYEYPKPLDEFRKNPTLKIWDDVMSEIYGLDKLTNSKKNFDIPFGVKKLSYDITSGETPTQYSKKENIRTGWFVE